MAGDPYKFFTSPSPLFISKAFPVKDITASNSRLFSCKNKIRKRSFADPFLDFFFIYITLYY